MKIAVLSDVHGNALALKYALSDIKKLGTNKLIILGDIVMRGPMPSESLELLRDGNFNILSWVKGNTDLWFREIDDNFKPADENEKAIVEDFNYAKKNLSEEQIEFIDRLPESDSIEVNGYKILCVHGTPKSIVEAIDSTVSEDDVKNAMDGVKEDIVLSGHSHTSYIGKCSGIKIFNVGSIGNSLDGDKKACYGILNFADNKVDMRIRKISYPIYEIMCKAKEKDFPNIDLYKHKFSK